jgi:glutathione S-transferase
MAALEEVGAVYEAIAVKMTPDGAGDEGYERLNPLRQVPVLVAGDRVIRETGAILTFLAGAYASDRILPRDSDGAVEAMMWLGYLGGAVHPMFRPQFRPDRFVGTEGGAQQLLRATSRKHLDRVLSVLGDHLDRNEWIHGQYCALDFYAFVFERWAVYLGLAIASSRGVRAHLERVGKLPAMQRALKSDHAARALK